MYPPHLSSAPPVRTMSVWRTLLLLAGASLLTVAVLFPSMLLGRGLPLSNEYGLSDLFDVNLPLRAWTAAQLRAGHFPVWYPGAYGGIPLFSLPEAAPAYPFSTLFYLLFPPVAATAWSLVAHLMLAGVGAGLVARRLGASLSGQVLAAVVISGGLWLPEHARQLNLVHAAAWVPWLWLALERWLRAPTLREGAILGLVGGLLGLAGHAQILHHSIIALGVWALYRLIVLHRGGHATRAELLHRAGTLALAAVVGLLIAAPALLPVAELAGMATRADNAGFQRRFPPHPGFLATLLRPMLFGDPTLGPLAEGLVWWEEALYVGLLPLVLAVGWLALAGRNRRQRRVWIGLIVLSVIALLLAYAPAWAPAGGVARLLPGASQFRFSQRYLWFVTLVFAVGAGLGLTALERWIAQRAQAGTQRWMRWAPALVLLLTVADLRLTIPRVCPVGDPSPQIARSAVLDLPALAGEPEAGRWSERFATYSRRRLTQDAVYAAHAWSGPQEPYGAMRAGMIGQYPSLWGWGNIQGYLGLTPRWAALATSDQHVSGIAWNLEDPEGKPLPEERLGLWLGWTGTLGARWITSAVPLKHPLLRAAGAAPTPSGSSAYLYENRAWTGAAWIAHGGAVAPVERDLLRYLAFRGPAQNRLMALQAPIPEPIQPLPSGAQSTLNVSGDPATGRLHVSGSAGAAGLAIINMDWHPRWRALRSGREIRSYRVNLAQVGVPVQAGAVEFDLRFDDRLERGCVAACLVGLLLGLGTPLLARKTRPRMAAQAAFSAAQPSRAEMA